MPWVAIQCRSWGGKNNTAHQITGHRFADGLTGRFSALCGFLIRPIEDPNIPIRKLLRR